MSAFEMEVQECDGFPVVIVKGYFNAEAGEKIMPVIDGLLQQGKRGIIIDITPCKVVNSQGISSLIDLVIKVQEDFRGKLVLAGLDQLKKNVFTTAGLLPLAHSVESPTVGAGWLKEQKLA